MAAAGPKTEAVGLNDVVRDCVTHMQPQASRAHVLIRTSLLSSPTAVTADGPAVRDIVVALLRNAIASSNAGGQVIVSTTLTPDEGSGKVTLRVRDTGQGLNERELAEALGQSPQSDPDAGGPVLARVKALAEGNGATFAVASGANEGTSVEIRFRIAPSAKER
jgi:signal transduction histidine kinase